MPLFRYTAADASGRVLEGTLQAASGQEATRLLQQQGLRVDSLSGGAGPGATRAVTVPVSQQVQPISRPVSTPAPVSADVVRTRKGKDKHLILIFSQLASYFRAGMDPRRAFEDVAYKCHPNYRDSLLEVSRRAGEGFRLADILERYPDLYPPHVVGMVRAGEAAGFLPEAFQEVADWALPSWRLKRALAVFNNVVVVLVIGYPIGLALTQGSLSSWDAQEASGGQTPVAPLLAHLVGKAIIPMLLPTIILLGLYYLGRWFWKSDKNAESRHRLLLTVPILGKRARAESLRLFAYALSLVSRAGVSPHSAFSLAADAMPNLSMRNALRDSARRADTSSKLSTLLQDGSVVPIEYRHLMETGEITGDIPAASLRVADASNIEFTSADGSTKYVKSFLGILVFGAGILMFFWLYRNFMLGEFTHILGE